MKDMSMNSPRTTAMLRTPGNRIASHDAIPCSLGWFADAVYDGQINQDRACGVRDRVNVDALTSAVEISPSDIVKRRVVSWRGISAESVNITDRRRMEYRFCGPVHLLALFEEGARTDGSTFVEGLPRSALRNYRRKLILVPAGHEYHDWQEPRSLARMAYFYFDPAALPVFDLGVADMSLAPRLFFEDDGLWDTAIKLKALIESPQADDRRYGEALGVVLAHELVRLSQDSPRVAGPVRGGLAGWQQRAVAGYIEEHLADQIPLATLAQLAGLSPYHFCRAFKQSFGMPPHRFHARRRIEHAKVLLAKRVVSVTEVGVAIGFSGTSAFTTAFRKATGLTPTGYHRNVT
jgi:AraC family transcriptional regulator